MTDFLSTHHTPRAYAARAKRIEEEEEAKIAAEREALQAKTGGGTYVR